MNYSLFILNLIFFIQNNFKNVVNFCSNQARYLIIAGLDLISWKCKQDINTDFQDCIAKNIPSSAKLVGAYYSTTLFFRAKIQGFVFIAPSITSKCFISPMATFGATLTSEKISIVKCIDSADSNNIRKIKFYSNSM